MTTTFDALIRAGTLCIGDGYRAKNSELGGDGPVFLRAGLVSDAEINLRDAERFRAELTPQLASKMSEYGDTLVTTKGNSTGRTSYVDFPTPRVVYSPHLSFWRSLDHSALKPLFLRYWARGEEFRDQLEGMSHSTDMAPYLSLVDQRRLRITLPAPDEQDAMCDSLGALDDKIELNRRMNRTLDEMAAALFRSWFVDFDPVVAKAAGRTPFGMDVATAALFPSSFEDSELGPIPRGWRVSTIGEEVRAVGGSTPSTDNSAFWSGGTFPWITPRDLAQLDDPVVVDSSRRITQAGLDVISSGLLPRGTVLLSSRAPIGYLAVIDVPLAVNQGFIAMVCDRVLPTQYVRRWTRENMDEILSRAGGTTFPEISKQNFRPIPVLVPMAGTLGAFTRLADVSFSLLVANVRESHTLAALRDTLLPKLLSGEIRLRDAERVVEAVS